MSKTAVILGARGQISSYLISLLLDKGYKVVGIERRVASPDYVNIKEFLKNPNLIMEFGDVIDFSSIVRILKEYKPDEFYNFAAISSIPGCSSQPIATLEINCMGVSNCLEAIRLVSPKTKFYQASSSECFGEAISDIQDEYSPSNPRNIYGVSKLSAEKIIDFYKKQYGLFACYSRNYNIESPKRGHEFLTRKVTSYIGKMFNAVNFEVNQHLDNQQKFNYALESGIICQLKLGNLDHKRSWLHCRDAVKAIYLMMQKSNSENYVLGSRESRSIKEFLDCAFAAIDVYDWSNFVSQDERFCRPVEKYTLCPNTKKIEAELGWKQQICFNGLVEEMVRNDIELNKRDLNVFEQTRV